MNIKQKQFLKEARDKNNYDSRLERKGFKAKYHKISEHERLARLKQKRDYEKSCMLGEKLLLKREKYINKIKNENRLIEKKNIKQLKKRNIDAYY